MSKVRTSTLPRLRDSVKNSLAGALGYLSWKRAFWIVVAALVVIVVSREAFSSRVLIDPFVVPKSLTDQGYTSQVVANGVVDEIHRISTEVRTRVAKREVGFSSLSALPDLEVPETKLSLRAVVQFTLELLHTAPLRATGEIVGPPTGDGLQVTVRITRGGEPVVRRFRTAAGADEAIVRSARLILAEIDPYVLASYIYQVERAPARAFELIAPCIRDEACKSRAWGFNFWGNMLVDEGRRDRRKLDEAVRKYQKAIELDPNLAVAYANWGRVLAARGKRDEAIAQFRRATQLDPGLAMAYNNWGVVLELKNDLKGAFAKYQDAIRIDRSFTPAYVNLGNLFLARKDLEAAEWNYRIAIDRQPRVPEAHAALGNLLLDRGGLEEAEAEYRKALDIESEFPAALNGLAGVLYNRKDWNGAVAAYGKLVKLDPESAVANTNLGNTLFQLKRYDEAVAYFRNSIALDPSYAPPHLGMAAVLDEQGKHSEAQREEAIAKVLSGRQQ